MDKELREQEVYRKASKEKLTKVIETKMKTVMVGAISKVEEKFGYLWSHGSDKDLDEDELIFKELFDELRSAIFDNGNNQIRNLKVELDNYKVEWGNRYSLPVKRMEK